MTFKDIKKIVTDKKTISILISIFLLTIVIITSISIRSSTIDLKFAENAAVSQIDKSLLNNIKAEIDKQSPLLPQAKKDTLALEELNSFKKDNKKIYNNQISKFTNLIKNEFQDEDNKTYIFAIDSYYYYRQAKNYLETGHVYDEIRDGEKYDSFMLAPLGRKISGQTDFHPKATVNIFKISQFFKLPYSLKDIYFLMPLLFSTLAVIFLFLLLQKTIGKVPAFLGSIYFAIQPSFVLRTIAGFSDTDPYVLFFPLMIIYFVISAIQAKRKEIQILFAALTGVSITIFATAWEGWWYIFLIVTAGLIAYMLLEIVKGPAKTIKKNIKKNMNLFKNKELRSAVIVFSVMIIAYIISIIPTLGFSAIIRPLTSPIHFLAIKSATKANLWPNVYTTVAELNNISFNSILNSLGGKLYIIPLLLSLVYIIIQIKKQLSNKYKEKKAIQIIVGLLGIIWTIGGIITTLKAGTRFIMLIIPGASILLAFAFQYIKEMISKALQKVEEITPIKSSIISIVTILIIGILILRPTYSITYSTVENQRPMMNDEWYQSLQYIDQNAAQDAIINSWWDFGHWFKAIGNRKVTFDGASQNTPQAHWIGKVLQTDNDDEAKGILRMLDCGANTAYDTIYKELDNPVETIELLDKIFPVNRTQAKEILLEKLSPEAVNKVIELTHCNAPEDYFITSDDMIGKAPVWAHFGLWNFTKADLWNKYKNSQIQEFKTYAAETYKFSQEEINTIIKSLQTISSEEKANKWISPWPGYGGEFPCEGNQSQILCNGVTIDLDKKEAIISNQNGAKTQPTEFIYKQDGKLITKSQNNTQFPYSIILEEKEDGYSILIADSVIAKSMFTKLYYFDGAFQNTFEKVSEKQNIGGGKIIVWKVKW